MDIKCLLRTLRLKYIARKGKSHVSIKCSIYDKVNIEDHVMIYGKTQLGNCHIGLGTYIQTNCELFDTRIGRFCSVANYVRIIRGTHPSSGYISTHPAFFSIQKQAGFSFVEKQKFVERKHTKDDQEYHTLIGNDVWICDGVHILEGIHIGNGAIIAAGAVVTEDVPPYAIVGGIPAKVIKYRFKQEQIVELESFQWWNKEYNWIDINANNFENFELFNNIIRK